MAQDFAYRNYSHTQGKVKNGGGGRASRDQARRAPTQHHLVHPEAVAAILAVADPSGSVLDPAAGEGALTRALARRGAQVTAYEPDPLLAAKLAAGTRAESGIRVVRADFSKAKPHRDPFAVVGNVPAAATARIIDWCLTAPALTSATLLTQLDCARAYSGADGHWSLTTALSWPWFDWQLHGQVDRTSFRPAPAADAAILHLVRRPEPLVQERDSYTDLVRGSFTADVHPDHWVRTHERLTG
ncbi:rRNA adenine N(6)-methyltransferase family protein [Nocardia sp. NPDC051832]|uniref:rRNA adenine N(6)-methyltransferase family protein n=1 Tax=Nocardia sp. NPDC051832 TaxID=3155673 RepID=UPI00341AE1B6